MLNDKQINISAAGNRKSKNWPSQTLYWSDFVKRLQSPVRSLESFAEYMRLPKVKQDELKDVGGYVGGMLKDGRRLEKNVINRDIIALDLDNIPHGMTQDVLLKLKGLGCAYAVYSTRKHEIIKPRLRVLIPANRPLGIEEYEPVARKIAEIINITWCDPTTFQASRLMYWPSCSRDSQYVFSYEDKPWIDVDKILELYDDWRDYEKWPQVPGAQISYKSMADKQEDPTTKRGIVGAFCKNYDVYAVMDKFLSGVYTSTEDVNRYTYTGGSTFGGVVVYNDGMFLYSHHATDPACSKLCNSYDLVRLHKFSDLDYEVKEGTPISKLPSYLAMAEFAVSDEVVASTLNKERYENATKDFREDEANDDNWFRLLSTSAQTGLPAKTVDNVLIILDNDPLLKNKIAFDEFANRGLILGRVPWDKREESRQHSDIDDAGLRHYLEKVYSLTGKERIYDAIALCAFKNTFNEVKSYLEGLVWDGKDRLNTLLSDYLGAENNRYTRAVIRKSLVAAVARIIEPGTKYDYMPIFVGPQGIGKSTFLKILGKRWYSDSLTTFEGKEASELIQGVWINEVGELNGLSKSETNAVKQFLSRTEDIFREPYGRRTSQFPRKCVFFGTTNDSEFLKDRTGNRRFWPVDVGINPVTKSVFMDLEKEVDQIWAEAVLLWKLGEQLYLSGEEEAEAVKEQERHRESNAKEGYIKEFIDKKVPVTWSSYSIGERLAYWDYGHQLYKGELIKRDRICAVEIWVECFKGDLKNMKRSDSLEINGILGSLEGLTRLKQAMKSGVYGTQKGFNVL